MKSSLKKFFAMNPVASKMQTKNMTKSVGSHITLLQKQHFALLEDKSKLMICVLHVLQLEKGMS